MDGKPAARLGDPVAHTMALPGALIGLAVGVIAGVAIIATGGLGAIAIGGALAVAGGVGIGGQYIGQSIMGPPTGAITAGSPNIFINGRPAARATLSLASCAKEYGVPQPEATGAATVYFNGMPAGRKDEQVVCSAIITDGSPDVFIGGPSVQMLAMNPEVPVWLSMTMNAMLWGGIIIGTGGIAAEYGLFAAAGSFFGGMAGSALLSAGARQLGEALGLSETAIRSMEVAGGFLGGIGGGYAGFRGGQWSGARLIPNPRTPLGGFLRGGMPAYRAQQFSNIGRTVSPQRQFRHVQGRPEWNNRGQGSYFRDVSDAQAVLDAAHSGNAQMLGTNAQGQPVIRYDGVTGYNNNPGAGYMGQPTNVFLIKGTKSPSVVPTNPNWRPR